MTAKFTILSIILFAIIPAAALAQNTATLEGTVTNQSGEPLPGANILIEGTSRGTAAGEDGTYRIENIDPGSYSVRVTFIGFQSQSVSIDFEEGATVSRDFSLERTNLQGQEIVVSVGSRAQKVAAQELAVPVDVYTLSDIEKTGTPELGQILQQVSPSVNFPQQTVADGMDALQSFTLRGLSPDHTLVLVNGKRRHKSALINRLGSGIQKGSSPVDLNAIPASAIQQIEVLRDGAAAQYGSDAIAGVVNIQLKDKPLPLTVEYQAGGNVTDDYEDDGFSQDLNASYGIPVGGGHINIFGEVRFSDPTNRAGPDPRDQIVEGDADEVLDVDGDGVTEVATKNNPVEQPNFHWGSGESNNYYLWTDSAIPLGESVEAYVFGGYSYRDALGQGFYRRGLDSRNWPQIYPQGFLPEFDIKINDYSASGGLRGQLGAWNYDLNAQTGRNEFEYNIDNTLNVTLGPTATQTSFYAGTVAFQQSHVSLDFDRQFDIGFSGPLNFAVGAIYRVDRYEIEAGEENSYLDGPVKVNQNGGRAAPGAQVFPGFRPSQAVDENRTNVGVYLDLESDITDQFFVNAATRFESYSDFGETLTGKLALRFQPQEELIFRGAISTGFRAPNLAQRYFSKVSTTFIDNEPFEVGLFNNSSDVAQALGVSDLEEETSFNLSGGLALSPTDNFTFTADVFYIEIYDRIILSGNLAGPEIEALVSEFGAQRVQVFSNAIDTKTWGIDFTASYQTTIGAEGSFFTKAAYNTTTNRLASGIATPARLSDEFGESIFGREARLELTRERPSSTLNLETTYSNGPFGITLIGKRYGEVLVPDDTPEEDFTLSPEFILNMSTSFDIIPDYATLTVGARNLLDNYPDLQPAGENFNGIFPYSTASPMGFNGRYVYSKIRFTF